MQFSLQALANVTMGTQLLKQKESNPIILILDAGFRIKLLLHFEMGHAQMFQLFFANFMTYY